MISPRSILRKLRKNDKWGFGYLIGWFVGGYQLYSTNLVCLANERFWYWYGWNRLFIGSYVYHSDVIAGYAHYVINLVK